MRELLSFIFDQFTDPLSLPIDPLYEWAILGVIGLIAYFASYSIVGDLYASGDLHGRFLGSLVHRTIRLLIFAAIWFVVYWVIVIGQWLITHWIIVLGSIISIVALYLLCRFMISHSVQPEKQEME